MTLRMFRPRSPPPLQTESGPETGRTVSLIAFRAVRPVVGAERPGRKPCAVAEVADRVVGPGIAHPEGKRTPSEETTTVLPSMTALAAWNLWSGPAI